MSAAAAKQTARSRRCSSAAAAKQTADAKRKAACDSGRGQDES
jgi:hypothetical protein